MDIQLRALAHTLITTFEAGITGSNPVMMRKAWVDLPAREGETLGDRTDAIDAAVDWLKAEDILRKIQPRGDRICLSVGGLAAMTKLTFNLVQDEIKFTDDYANNKHTFRDFFKGVSDGSLRMQDFVVPALLIKFVKEARVL